MGERGNFLLDSGLSGQQQARKRRAAIFGNEVFLDLVFLWSLNQDLALRLLCLSLVDIGQNKMSYSHDSELQAGVKPLSGQLKEILRKRLFASDGYLVDKLPALCSELGISITSFLPTRLVAAERQHFERWAEEASPVVDLPTLYARFPSAAHSLMLSAAGRGEGLRDHQEASRWLLERGLEARYYLPHESGSEEAPEELAAELLSVICHAIEKNSQAPASEIPRHLN